MAEINLKKMKQWFKHQGKRKKVQFHSSGGDFSEIPQYPARRAVTPDFPLDRSPLSLSMSASGQSTPSNHLANMVRSRTPDGSLTSYYMEDEPPAARSQKSSSLPRQPLHSEPRFTSENVDSNIRGRNHGYYIKASGIGEQNGNKENLKLIYDRSRVASPVTSGHNSQYTSKISSNMVSRSGSFRNKGGHRRYLPKKRPAPRPPGSSNGGEPAPYRPYNSLDSRTSNGEVAMKVFRKKRKAPQPPAQVQRGWVDDQLSKSPFRALVVDAEVYPIEPPVDYNKKVEQSSEEDDDEEDVVEADEPMIDEPQNEAAERQEEPAGPQDDEVAMETTPPVSPQSIPPPPPPPPPPVSIVIDPPQQSFPPSPVIEQEPKQPDVSPSSPKEKLPRIGSLLRKDIVKAAMERTNKGFVEPKVEYKSPHQIFAAELVTKVNSRDERMKQGALKVRALSSSRMFRARPSLTPTEEAKNPLDDMIERAQEQARLRDDRDDEKRRIRGSARVMTREWLPEHDLDDVFNQDVRHPSSQLTARGGNYYDVSNPSEDDILPKDTAHVLYRKNHYAKASRKKSGNLEKFRKSIGKAFGSIGKGLHRKTAEIQEMYSKEDGWEIIFKEECDSPPTEMIKIKRMEKHPAYAYHAEKEQLILLPDFDRIIVTQDGRRIRETEMSKSGKQGQNKSLPSFTRKERPSLDGVFQSGSYTQDRESTHSDRTTEERKQIALMEDQFAQVRKINKTQAAKKQELSKQWKSTPDLVQGVEAEPFDAGVFSDTDLPLRTSSMRTQDKEKAKKKKKSKSKKSSSSSEGKSPRQRVLQKGMDYYIRSRPTTPNPVYSSDEENDDDNGYDQAPANSDQTSSDSSSKPKSDSLGDSGIGQESLNSSASTASGAPIAAQMQQEAALQQQRPLDPSQAPMYFTSMPNPVFLAPVTSPVMLASSMQQQPGAAGNPSPMMYQTMYYPSHSLPHGAHMPPQATAHTTGGDTRYHTLPADTTAMKHNETGITNSDSNSTLVASNNSTLEHKSTVTVTDTAPPEEMRSTSKVMNVTPNIAVVSYNNNSAPVTMDSHVKPSDNSDFQRQMKKQYVMGPIGFRPVKFDPSVKTKPVSLPEKAPSGLDMDSNVASGDPSEGAVSPPPGGEGEVSVEKQMGREGGEERTGPDTTGGRVSPSEMQDEDRINNNDKNSGDPIPEEIRQKYADEELIYL